MPDTLLLMQARLALRNGALDTAQDCYRRYLDGQPDDAGALQEFAAALFAQGRSADAECALNQAIRLRPESTTLRFNRALARQAQGRADAALADLDELLAANPAHLQGRLHRGALHFHGGNPAAALADFERAQALAPDALEGHFNAGLSLLRLDRGEEALASLLRALELAPSEPAVLRALGNALREIGRFDESLARHRDSLALDPRNPIAHADYGLCLLATGQTSQAILSFRQALELDPGDQTALAALYLACNESGQSQDVAELMDRSLCVRERLLPTDQDVLREAVLSHPALRWEPFGKTTIKGEQTAFLSLLPGSPFAAFGAQIAAAIQARCAALAGDPQLVSHPWLRSRPPRWRLNMWATVLREGGHQAPHIHPAGWMSGVFYLDDGQADATAGGTILFGRGPDELALKAAPVEWSHQPQTGDLLLFPSYFYHRTLPFHGSGTRISLAFDVIRA